MLRWQLPEHVSDAMPDEARRIEDLRRKLLDFYRSYGYELVAPPLLEHLDSLLTGSGSRLSLRTFKLVDQLSGRTLGIRADTTPQAARIDAHLLNRNGVTRLCYAGPILHTLPTSLLATREPIQVGTELFGHSGQEAELEVLELMVRSVGLAEIRNIRIDLAHASIVPALMGLMPAEQQAAVDPDKLYEFLVQKDQTGLGELLAASPAPVRDGLCALCELFGPVSADDLSVLTRARSLLPTEASVTSALDELEALVQSMLWQRLPGVSLAIDLADLQGYHYYSGVSFSVFALPEADGRLHGESLARGGRYDGVGAAFGRSRPAVGFSLELRTLAELGNIRDAAEPRAGILAPWLDDTSLRDVIDKLRADGEIVLQVLPGHEQEQSEFACDRELVMKAGHWEVQGLVAKQ
ncbi:MAG: ATP phosphoribosyltransferase regulatory subunit [Burkholderiaceae bacterium]